MSIKNVLLGGAVLALWGSVAGTNRWSYESACWVNIAQYGMVRV
jgi:hypothetical protein